MTWLIIGDSVVNAIILIALIANAVQAHVKFKNYYARNGWIVAAVLLVQLWFEEILLYLK